MPFAVSLSLFATVRAEETTAPKQNQTNAPTGTYATTSPIPMTVRLITNGTYEATCDGQDKRGSQTGTWQWDAQRREFRLKPTAGNFPFALRRLRVDKHEEECLQWIPEGSMIAPAAVGGVGAIDYVRLKRQKNDP
jgi:hypothetical protein